MTASDIHILIVEGNPEHLRKIREAFQDSGIRNPSFFADSLRKARERLSNPNLPLPRVMLLGQGFPDGNELDFLASLRQEPVLKPISVYFLPHEDSPEIKRNAFDLNVSGFIPKPSDSNGFNHLTRTLNELWGIFQFV